jgi:cell shape-determining protein MreD
MRIFIVILLSLLVFFLSVNAEKILLLGNISFKPIIILLYFVTLYWNPIYGLFIGFFLGFIYEPSLPVLTGTYSIVFTSSVVGLKIIEKKIFKFRYNSLILLFCTVFFIDLIQVVMEVRKTGPIFSMIFTYLLPQAALNTLIGFVILYFIMRKNR